MTRAAIHSLLLAWFALAAGCDASSATHPDAAASGSSAPATSVYIAGAACNGDGDCPGGHCLRAQGRSTSEPGYCTAACSKPSDCGSLATCSLMGAGDGQCLAACVAQEECRAGFRCVGGGQLAGFTLPGACRPLAAADTLAAGIAGRACSSDQDCSGGTCASRTPVGASYPGGYCSGRCYDDAACGPGGVCLALARSADAGHCLQACTGDADCTRAGYRCFALGDGTRMLNACLPGAKPLPDGVVGRPCSADGECAGGLATCAATLSLDAFTTSEDIPAPGGYCTQACHYDGDCGSDGQCITSGLAGGRCLASCSDTTPCREGYECVAHLRDGDPAAMVCIPERFPPP